MLCFFMTIVQAIDIRQIQDKFPDRKGGLRELYEQGSQSAFYLVKFWVSIIISHYNCDTFALLNVPIRT